MAGNICFPCCHLYVAVFGPKHLPGNHPEVEGACRQACRRSCCPGGVHSDCAFGLADPGFWGLLGSLAPWFLETPGHYNSPCHIKIHNAWLLSAPKGFAGTADCAMRAGQDSMLGFCGSICHPRSACQVRAKIVIIPAVDKAECGPHGQLRAAVRDIHASR